MLQITFLNIRLNAQIQSEWPDRTNGISIFATTIFGIFTPVNLSYDYLVHKEKVHYGITTGLTTTFCEGVDYAQLGVHLTFTFMTGKSKHHFESKLGLVYNPILLYSEDEWHNYAFKFVPVISLGYRFQQPDGRRFYRLAVSTGGIGAGTGFIF